MYHFISIIALVCNPLLSLRCQFYFFTHLHKTVRAVLYFSYNCCSGIDLNFVFVLSIECSSTVDRSDAPCLRASFRSSFNWPLLSRQRSLRPGRRMQCDLALLA